jgi:DNA-binding IclR family transcriptional regulator
MSNQSISQSVARMISVFELFERERRPLTSADIGAALTVPRSSLGALLRTLVDLSVLALDRRSATYLPTAHFARLGAWLTESVAQDPRIYDLLKHIQAATGETVTLACPTDLCMELVHVERGNQIISFIADRGQRFSFWGTALGTAYLGTLPPSAIAPLYERCVRAGGEMAPRVPLRDITQIVASTRRSGFAEAFGAVFPDASAVSVALPEGIGIRRSVLSVAGPTDRIRQKESMLVALLKAEVALLQNNT